MEIDRKRRRIGGGVVAIDQQTAVERIVAAISVNGDILIIEQALRALACICTQDENGAGLEKTLAAIRLHPQEADIQVLGCDLMKVYLEHSACMQMFQDSGGIYLVMMAMQVHRTNGVVLANCLAVLQSYAGNGGNMEGVPASAILIAMRNHPTDRDLQREGVRSLLVFDYVGAELCAEGAKLVVVAMQSFPGDLAVQSAGCQTLAAFRGKVEEDGLAAIVKAMERYPERVDVQEAGLRSLWYAPVSYFRAEPAVREAVIRGMQSQLDHPRLVYLACRMLRRGGGRKVGNEYASNWATVARQVAAAALDRVTVEAMAKWDKEEDDDDPPSDYIFELLMLPEQATPETDFAEKVEMAEEVGFRAIIQAMKRFSDDEGVHLYFCSTISHFADSMECCRKIRTEGGIEAIISAMNQNNALTKVDLAKTHTDEVHAASVLYAACKALGRLVKADDACRSAVFRAGGVESILPMLDMEVTWEGEFEYEDEHAPTGEEWFSALFVVLKELAIDREFKRRVARLGRVESFCNSVRVTISSNQDIEGLPELGHAVLDALVG